MAKVAIVSVGSPGHTYPTLGLSEELVRRGHDVLQLCGAELAPAVASTGARAVAYPTQFRERSQAVSDLARIHGGGAADPDVYSELELRLELLDECERGLPALADTLGRERPDVVVYEPFAYAVPLICEPLGIPRVRAIPFPPLEFVPSALAASASPETLARWKAKVDRVDAVARHHGARPLPTTMMPWNPYCDERFNLVLHPRRFLRFDAPFFDRFQFVGPCLRPIQAAEAAAAEQLQPPGDAPLVYVSLGTIHTEWPAFYRICLDALGGSAFRVILSVASAEIRDGLGDLPENVLVAATVPQRAVLARTRVFVTHGGMGSTMEALSAGVRMVMVPQVSDQRAHNAPRAEELGLARVVHPEALTADALAEAVRSILADPDWAARSAEMQRAIADAGGAVRAAELVEDAAAGPAPSPPIRR